MVTDLIFFIAFSGIIKSYLDVIPLSIWVDQTPLDRMKLKCQSLPFCSLFSKPLRVWTAPIFTASILPLPHLGTQTLVYYRQRIPPLKARNFFCGWLSSSTGLIFCKSDGWPPTALSSLPLKQNLAICTKSSDQAIWRPSSCDLGVWRYFKM